MAAGRCPGCGFTASSRKARIHILDCPDFLELFRTDPTRCLDPEDEYVRYKAEDDSPDARAERRDARLQDRFADMDRRQSMEADRWQPERDILAD